MHDRRAIETLALDYVADDDEWFDIPLGVEVDDDANISLEERGEAMDWYKLAHAGHPLSVDTDAVDDAGTSYVAHIRYVCSYFMLSFLT